MVFEVSLPAEMVPVTDFNLTHFVSVARLGDLSPIGRHFLAIGDTKLPDVIIANSLIWAIFDLKPIFTTF